MGKDEPDRDRADKERAGRDKGRDKGRVAV